MFKLTLNFNYSRHSVNGPSVTGNIQLTDFYKSGNRMARLRDYIFYIPTIQLPDEMSGNWMVYGP